MPIVSKNGHLVKGVLTPNVQSALGSTHTHRVYRPCECDGAESKRYRRHVRSGTQQLHRGACTYPFIANRLVQYSQANGLSPVCILRCTVKALHTHAHIHTHTHTHTHAQPKRVPLENSHHTHTHALANTHTETHSRNRCPSKTHAYAHTREQTNAHTHTHTLSSMRHQAEAAQRYAAPVDSVLPKLRLCFVSLRLGHCSSLVSCIQDWDYLHYPCSGLSPLSWMSPQNVCEFCGKCCRFPRYGNRVACRV